MNLCVPKFLSRALCLVVASLVLREVPAATVWTGPTITWTKSSATPTDTILPGKVVLKRDSRAPLYNTALNEKSAGNGSPKGVLFAFGDISDFQNLSYQSLDSLRNGNLAARIVNKPMVAHIVDGDIYFSITFTQWGTHGAGGVSYKRSTPSAVVPPTVALTSPADNSSFTAPASVNLVANAGNGTITGVSFFNGNTLLQTVAAAPYTFTVNNLAAGSYTFTAVATTADSSATSGVVHVTVTAPAPTVTITSPSEGATFTAPASVNLSANATGTDITGVTFLNGSTVLGTVNAAPYNFTAQNLPAGAYSITAVVATSSGPATSGVVHVTISAPATDVRLTAPTVSNGQFKFSYTADPGSSYLVEAAATLNATGQFDWAPVSTNIASGITENFSQPVAASSGRFFRVGRLTP